MLAVRHAEADRLGSRGCFTEPAIGQGNSENSGGSGGRSVTGGDPSRAWDQALV